MSRVRSMAIELLSGLALVGILLSGCRGRLTPTLDATVSSGTKPTPIPAPLPGAGLSHLAGVIMKNAQPYDGQSVTLVGYFRGQDLMDEVLFDAPVDATRDWVLKDDSGAIYVTYFTGMPFASTSQEIWRIVRVTGKVQVHRNGTPYIVPSEVKWEGLTEDYDVLPAQCKVAVHQFGGKDQLDHHIYWYTTRNLVVYDAKENWRGVVELKRSLITGWDQAFAQTKFFALPSVVGKPCDGCTRYYIAAVNDQTATPHFVTLYEGQVPADLQAFVDQMIAKTGEARGLP
jgi:hypothetical protein